MFAPAPPASDVEEVDEEPDAELLDVPEPDTDPEPEPLEAGAGLSEADHLAGRVEAVLLDLDGGGRGLETMLLGDGLIHRDGVRAVLFDAERPVAVRVGRGHGALLAGELEFDAGDRLLGRVLQDAVDASVRGGRVAGGDGLGRQGLVGWCETERHQ